MVCQSNAFKDTIYLHNLKILNVMVMVASVFMLFVGYELLTTYLMDHRYFSWSQLHLWPIHYLPMVLISIGTATLITSIVGFMCSVFQSKRPMIGYAIIMVLLVLGNFGCVFVAFKAHVLIEVGLSNTPISDPHFEVIKLYHSNEDFRSSWDELQSQLRCCGGNSYKDFYVNTTNKCFPSSCTLPTNETCEGVKGVKKVSYFLYLELEHMIYV